MHQNYERSENMSESVVKSNGRPFQKGVSGNPKGRPKGALNKTTLLLEQMLEGEAEVIGRKCIEMAKDGDSTALRLCIERLISPRRERPVNFDFSEIKTLSDVTKTLSSTIGMVASGEMTTGQGLAIASTLEAIRRAIQAEQFGANLEKFELLIADLSSTDHSVDQE